jgi:hypothetical protein
MSAIVREKKEGHEPVDGRLLRAAAARQDWASALPQKRRDASGFRMKL